MLGVGLRKLCPQDSFGYAFRERNLSENRPPEGAKATRGGSKMVSGRPPDGSFVPVARAAKAARKPCLRALLGRLWRSWSRLGGLLGRARPLLGASWGSFWDSPRADLDDLDVLCGAT